MKDLMDIWIQDGFMDTRLISGFTMDFWIHDGFIMGLKNVKTNICPSSTKSECYFFDFGRPSV